MARTRKVSDWFLEPEFEEVYLEWKKNPSPENNTRLLKAINPILNTAVTSYAGQSSPVVRSQAKILALNALETYDPYKAKLRTHLLTQLQRLRRNVGQMQQIVQVPERLVLDSMAVSKAVEEFQDRYGRDPSDAELADLTGLSKKRLAKIRQLKPVVAEGQTYSFDTEGELQELTVPKATPQAWVDFVYQTLDPKDQLIMEHTLGLNGKKILSKSAIARKLGVSPSAITYRLRYIQSQLDANNRLSASLF